MREEVPFETKGSKSAAVAGESLCPLRRGWGGSEVREQSSFRNESACGFLLHGGPQPGTDFRLDCQRIGD
jgi:hypothetical protein